MKWGQLQAAFPRDKLALLRYGLSLDGQQLLAAQVDWQNPEQLRFERGEKAPDPTHVRAGRAVRDRAQARAHRPRQPGQPAHRSVALPGAA